MNLWRFRPNFPKSWLSVPAVCCLVGLSLQACGGSPGSDGSVPPGGQTDGGVLPDGQADAGSSANPDGAASSSACAAVQDLRVSSSAGTSVSLAWTGATGVKVSVYRKTYCGSDSYELLAALPAGASSYTDTSAQVSWVYWYEINATDAANDSVSNAIAASAGSTSGSVGCSGGGVPQDSGATTSTCSMTPPGVDSGAPPTADGGPSAGSDAGSLSAPTGIPPGATVISPNSDVASAVESCNGGVVYFNPGTYTLTSSINVPANCTLMGAPQWTSIITGGTGNRNGTLFQFNHASNITVTELHFQNVNSQCLGNENGSGSGNISGTHIDLNLFEHFPNEVTPVTLFDPADLTIERNAFNDLQEDAIHLMSSSATGVPTRYPSSNIVVRWNFGSNQGYGTGGTGAFIEIQLGTTGLQVYQNVWYSQAPGRWEGMAFSIASGNMPCTSDVNGSLSGCPPLDDGKNGVTIDGNVILDNGQPAGATDNMAGIEVMGTAPLVQNNYIRHWPDLGMYIWIFGYDASNGTYSLANGVLSILDNTACDTYDKSTFPAGWYDEGTADPDPITVNYSGNQYTAASCADSAAPPALYPQIVVPPELLDSSGGMWAITNSTVTGPNTYWPNINAASGL